jgi:Zn-finger nucleic acid-binding protein
MTGRCFFAFEGEALRERTMKPNLLPELLKKNKNAPFFQCPQCRTVWLVTGGEALNSYTCRQCHHQFDLAQARYKRTTSSDKDNAQLPVPG